ncbi:MAG: RNA-binding S4 domain-containing protein [Eubacteriales bacterium]|nr:RNA-binding S4 domain-containing protein [Eubacteriales bacterium]
MKKVKISTEYIKLDQFIKWCGEAGQGSDAKEMVLDGGITVNGEQEIRRGRKLRAGDTVMIKGNEYIVE